LAEVKNAVRMAEAETSEIRSLNAADLDVEELEARIEIAVVVPNMDSWATCCTIDLGCS